MIYMCVLQYHFYLILNILLKIWYGSLFKIILNTKLLSLQFFCNECLFYTKQYTVLSILISTALLICTQNAITTKIVVFGACTCCTCLALHLKFSIYSLKLYEMANNCFKQRLLIKEINRGFGMHETVAPRSQVARHLGVSQSVITNCLQLQGKVVHIQMYIGEDLIALPGT